jgi:serine protease Do
VTNLNADTIKRLKKSTCEVQVPHPNPQFKKMPMSNGTGFFVSPMGHFITARHVLLKMDESGKPITEAGKNVLHNASDLILTKSDEIPTGPFINKVALLKEWERYDLVLLKADFSDVKNQEWFKGKEEFDYLEISFDIPPEGTEVYAFGYPLARSEIHANDKMIVGLQYSCPRLTSAIISAHFEVIGPVRLGGPPSNYVIDKALNYGNSGGPIVIQENGKVISVCVRFQPVGIPQNENTHVTIPSLYGITASLKNIEKDFLALLQVKVECAHTFVVVEKLEDRTVSKCSKCGLQKIVF